MKRFGGTVQGYDWCGTRVRLARYNRTTGTVHGYDWHGAWVRLVRYKGTTGTVQGYDWHSARVRLVRCKGTTGTAQGYDWYGARVRLVRYKGTTGTVQGYDWCPMSADYLNLGFGQFFVNRTNPPTFQIYVNFGRRKIRSITEVKWKFKTLYFCRWIHG